MRKLCSLLLAIVLLLSVTASFSFPAAAASLPDKVEYNGTEYYDVTKKDDYYNVVQYAFDNLLEHVNVCINKNSPDYDRNYTNDVRNFTGIQTVTIFDYAGYSPNTVCFTDTKNTPEYAYGTIDIEFSDSAEELKKADDIIDRDLAGIKGKSVKDKVRYVADYVCSKAEYGSKKMPDGGYDLINGVYEALSGIRTNTVCATYAMTFQYIMERLGIDSRLICNGYHAWNIVKIDNYWYGVDCTIDAGQTIEPSALLMSGDHMKSSYATDRKDWYSAVKKQFQLAPTAAATTAKPTTAKPSTKPNTTVKQPTGTTTTTTEVTTATTETESTTDTVDTSTPSAPAITVKADSEPIKADVFQTAKESQTALKIEGENYGWQFEAQNLDNLDVVATGFDSRVYTNDAVTEEQRQVVASVTEEEHFVFSFAHHGALPGEAVVSLQVDTAYADKKVDVYSIDDNGKAVKECTVTVDAASQLTFPTGHCSVWFITEAAQNNLLWLWIAIGAVLLLIVIVVVCILLRKKVNH